MSMTTVNPHTAEVARYRTVSERLLQAIANHHAAEAARDAARDAWEDRKRQLILDGIPGVPERCAADLREAAIARALEPETTALRATRDRLREAEAELEAARVLERAERESLRALYLGGAE